MSENIRPGFDPELKLNEMLEVWESKDFGGPWKTGDLLNFLGTRALNNVHIEYIKEMAHYKPFF